MRNTISKAIVAGVAALSLATACRCHGRAGVRSVAWRRWAWRRLRRLAWRGRRLAWRRLAWRGLAWRLGRRRRPVLASRLLERRHVVRRMVGSGGRGGPRGRRHRHLSLLGLRRRLWRLRRQLLAGSSGLRRLRQPVGQPAGQRLPVITTVRRIGRGLAQAGPFLFRRWPVAPAGHRLRHAGRGRKGERRALPRA